MMTIGGSAMQELKEKFVQHLKRKREQAVIAERID
jgi:hypothetical protein